MTWNPLKAGFQDKLWRFFKIMLSNSLSLEGELQTHVNSCLQLVQGYPTTVAQHLPTNILTDGCGSWLEQFKNQLFQTVRTVYGRRVARAHLPSRCSSMLVLSRFFARATSFSVTLVQRDILRDIRFYF